MEETSEQRRKRLQELRAQASSGDAEADEPEISHKSPLLPLPLHAIASVFPSSTPSEDPTNRFDFYTDPLAAFSSSHRKKKPREHPCPSPGPVHVFPKDQPQCSPMQWQNYPWEQQNTGAQHQLHHQQPVVELQPPLGKGTLPPYAQLHAVVPSTSPRGSATSQSPTPPPSIHPRIGIGSPSCITPPRPPSASSYEPKRGFGSPQRFGGGGSYPRPVLGSVKVSTPFSQHAVGIYYSSEKKPWGGGSSESSNSSRIGYLGGYSENSSMERHGKKGHQKARDVSARDCPHLFYKKSMVIDPWKDLIPVRLDIATVGTEDQLPKSTKYDRKEPSILQVIVPQPGPSLAESLAASLADAVHEGG